MTDNQEHKIVKILYVIPEGEDDAGQGEGLWAYSLGNQLYELQNIPVYAEHLNIEDVVFCDEPADNIPVIQKLIKRSGNRTLRVIFTDESPDDTCVDILRELSKRNILSEKAAHKRFMFNVGPDTDYDWALNYLKEKEEEGLLWLYEQPPM
jgi:hypothetical protein